MADSVPARRRPRILFIDDQRDVARTLSTLLAPLAAECRFADDGEAGLQRLRSEVFDLAVIDLAMPPTEWGGLWLLTELARNGIKTPSIVLSGQATQAETIAAMRAGAADFVVKDEAAEELHDIVSEVLSTAARSHWEFATSRLPAPVSIPLVRSRLQTDDMHRLRSSIQCAESIFRFTALAAAAVAGAAGRDLLVEGLARPSMGSWRSLCRKLQDLVAVPALDHWLAAVGDPLGGELVSLRNDLHHGAEPTPRWARERLSDVQEWLALFVTIAATRPAMRTVVVDKLEHTSSGFIADVADLAGEANAVGWGRLVVENALIRGHVHLIISDMPPIDLWPLVLAQPADRIGVWDVSVLDSSRSAGKSTPNPASRLRYINLTLGTRADSDRIAADLKIAGTT